MMDKATPLRPQRSTLRALCGAIWNDLLWCSGGNRRILLITWWLNVSFAILKCYRLAHFLQQRPSLLTGILIARLRRTQMMLGACDISSQAQLGQRITLAHPLGIVIGAGVEIADGVTIYQQVTLGSHGKPGASRQYPTIGEGATLFAGAKIVGPVRVGTGAKVGANAVVLCDVPDGAIAVGVPAKVRGHG